MGRLHELSTRLTATVDLPSILQEVLDATMELQHADFGDVALYDEAAGTLKIVAHRGLTREFLDYFHSVCAADTSSGGLALRAGSRIVIEDVETHPDYAPHRRIAAATGYRAVQATPLFDGGTGKLVGMLSTLFREPHRPSDRELRLTDLYARQAADLLAVRLSEDRLRKSQTRLKAAIDLVGLGCYAWDPQTNALEWDSSVKAMWGLLPDATVDHELWRNAIHPDDLARVEAAIARCTDPGSGGIYDVEYRVLGINDGVERWIATRAITSFENGKPVVFFGVVLDVTERKRSEQEHLLLIAELQHRTRNLLGVVAAISNETAASSRSVEDFHGTFSDRIAALSRVQGLLSRGEANPVRLGELVGLELRALGAEPDGRRVTVAGPDVALPDRSVQILALALHELATNARKHGALAAPEGRLAVSWVETSDAGARALALEWRESGSVASAAHAGVRRKGFGRVLIEEALPYQLDAQTRLEFEPDGIRCSVRMSLEPTLTGGGR